MRTGCVTQHHHRAKQALLLTGTGLTNLAALHASGLHKDEAKMHLQKALLSGEKGAVGPAAEALEFCEREVRTVEERIISTVLV